MIHEEVHEGAQDSDPKWVRVSVDTTAGTIVSSPVVYYGGPSERSRAIRAAKKAVNILMGHTGARTLLDGAISVPLDDE